MHRFALTMLLVLSGLPARGDLLLTTFSSHDLSGRFQLSIFKNTNTAIGENPRGLSWTLFEAGTLVPGRITVGVPGSGPSQITSPQFWSATVSGSGVGGSEITWSYQGASKADPFEKFTIDQTSLADGPLTFGFHSGLSAEQLSPGTRLPLTGTLSGAVTIPGFGTFSGAEPFTATASAVPEPSSFILFSIVLCVTTGRRQARRTLQLRH